MRAVIQAVFLGVIGGAIGGGVATANDGGNSGPPDVPVSSTDSPAAEDAKATLTALRTQPQVPTVRGGTLGIPSVFGSEGLQAILSKQAIGTAPSQPLPGKIDFDLFTRLGGLQLFDSFTVDILAESYKQDLAHVDLLTRPVLPHMLLTQLRDIGFRARWTTANNTQVSVIEQHARNAPNIGGTV
jgi:hypothetical protein